MADISYGAGGGNLDDLIRRAQAAAAAEDELKRKEAERAAQEERSTTTEDRAGTTRRSVADTTNQLTSAITRNEAAISAETAAIAANTAAWRANAEARSVATGTSISRVGTAGVPPVAAGVAGAEADPAIARQRYNAALAAQAEADAARRRATSAYTSSLRPTSGASTEEQAGLLGQREAAAQAAQAARQEAQAARASVAAAEQVAAARAAELAEIQRSNQALAAQRQADQQSAAEAAAARTERAASAVSGTTPAQLGSGRRPIALLPASIPSHTFEMGPASTEGAAGGAAAEDANISRVQQHQRVLASLSGEEGRATAAVNQATAAYAASSQVLTRHGALTTEFIQAFARGQVTLGEFSSQMLSTIGKFGGWAVAAAAVYGVFDAFKHLTAGASESQAAVQQLGRFIPGLGGPAGGGNSQVGAAQSTVRNISTEFNVPMKEVVDTMQVMARVFHDVAGAGEATRAVLAAYRLDQVPVTQGEQYLTGIKQSLNLSPTGVVGVVNSLNALQSNLSARVSQTLPAVARAAPAALAGGLDPHELEALAALGVRSGITGPQVGTALLRSIGTFAFRSDSQTLFREHGITPTPGQYGDLIGQIMRQIDTRQAQGRPFSGNDLRSLATGLGGPLLGTRTLLPLLLQEQIHPGTYQQAVDTAAHPRPYGEDLGQVLVTVGERFKAIGIALENFGSRIGPAVLQPLIAASDVLTTFIHVIETALNPLSSVIGELERIPGPIRDMIAAFIAVRVAQRVFNSNFGSNAQGFVGRLPGFGALDSEPRQAIRGTLGRLQTYELPRAQGSEERADAALVDAQSRRLAAAQDLNQYTERNAASAEAAGVNSEEYAAYMEEVGVRAAALQAAISRSEAAETRAAAAGERVAQVKADIAVLSDAQYSTDQKTAYLAKRQLAVAQEIVNVQDQRLAEMRALMTGDTAGGARGAGGAGAGGDVVAGAGAAAAAAAVALSQDSGALGDLQTGLQSSGVIPVAPERPAAPVEAARTPAASEAAQAAAAEAQLGLLGSLVRRAPTPISSRLSSTADAVDTFGQRIRQGGITSGPAALAGLIAAPVVGGAIGGGAGNYISDVGGTAATGLFLANMLKPGNATASRLGLSAGLFFGGQQVGGNAGGITSGIGGAIGALSALDLVAPQVGLPLQAAAAVAGGVGGFLFGKGGGQAPSDPANEAQRNVTVQLARLQGLPQGNVPGWAAGGGIPGWALSDQQRQYLATRQGDAGSAATQAQQRASQQLRSMQNASGQISSFGDQFSQDLVTAFEGSGSSAQKAQAKIQAQVQNLTAEIELFGASAPQGKAAKQALDQIITAAAAQAATDPAAAKQVLDSALQARQGAVDTQFKYNLAQAPPGQGATAVQTAAGQLDQLTGVYQNAADQARETLAGAEAQLQAAQKGRNETVIKAAQAWVAQAKNEYTALQSVASRASEANTLAKQAYAQTAYQKDVSSYAAEGQLGQSVAGGDVSKQLQSQALTLTRQLNRAASDPNLDPVSRTGEIDKSIAGLVDVHNKYVQNQLQQIQSQGTLAVSQTPVGDTAAQAQAQYQAALNAYNYAKAHASVFDPKDLNALAAAVNDARKAALEAAGSFATQMNDLRTNIAVAQDYGNAVAQAADKIRGAAANLASAKTPQQRLAAQGNLISAENDAHQAAEQRVQAQTQLAEAQNAGDSVAVAQAAVAGAQKELAMAHGIDQQIAAETALAQAQAQLAQAYFSRIQAQGAVAEAQATGNTVEQAQIAISTAQQMLGSARGIDQQLQAEQALAQAQAQYRQALEQRYEQIGQLNASQTLDPVKKLRDEMRGVAQALSVAQGPDETRALQINLNNLRQQWESAVIQQRQSTTEFQLNMQQITTQQAINQLEDLLKLKGVTLQERQQILERIRQLQLSDTTTGQFDLSPGNIKLPTVYDVRRAMAAAASGAPTAAGAQVNAYAATTINVEVNDPHAVAGVADAIDRATGSNLHARLRAAGLRGT